MKFLRKFLARKRIKRAQKRVAQRPSPSAYAELAQEYARIALHADVVRVCDEGLSAFPGNVELARLGERARQIDREERISELKSAIESAPRPALYGELCEVLLASGSLQKAEACVQSWIAFRDDGESRLALGQVRLDRYFADRAREQGRQALEAIGEAQELLPGDPRPWRLRLDLTSRVGAWSEAKQCVTRLLELEPGNPELEGRFRTLESLESESPTLQKAFLAVERTGHFADEDVEVREGNVTHVRPLLRELAAKPDVHAALYVRGATVLIQGPKGATAERTARSVGSILTGSRATARRIGLGQVQQVQLEGDFGVLSIAPGELDAGAIWSRGPLGRQREEALLGLAGINADVSEVEA